MLVGLTPGNPHAVGRGIGTPIGRGFRKPCDPTFPQFKLVIGYADDSASTSKIFTIFEGTSEIQRMLIGRAVTGLDVR
jgi:alkylation response protein AidB-like acyl-CoA dehydrogenase